MYYESRLPVQKLLGLREAEELLAINNFPGQKTYSPLKGKTYAENMASGKQRRIDIAVARIKGTTTDYLMNGQHNCHAVILNGKPYSAVISYYVCDNMEDAWRLFATFDVHNTRSAAQFMKSRRGIFRDKRLHDVPIRTLTAAGSALKALESDPPRFSARLGNKTECADLVEANAEDVLFLSRYNEWPHMVLVGVAAAVIATFRVSDQNLCEEFWGKVANGEMLKKDDHAYALREFLAGKNHKVELGSNGRAKQDNTYCYCIAWWNSWRQGVKRSGVKLKAMKETPKIVP